MPYPPIHASTIQPSIYQSSIHLKQRWLYDITQLRYLLAKLGINHFMVYYPHLITIRPNISHLERTKWPIQSRMQAMQEIVGKKLAFVPKSLYAAKPSFSLPLVFAFVFLY